MTTQEAINVLSDAKWSGSSDAHETWEHSQALEMAIDALNTNRWISVEEKTPVFPCIICDVNGNRPYVPSSIAAINGVYVDAERLELRIDSFWWAKKGLHKKTIEQITKAIADGNRIVAWMPLPEPYREV